MSRPSKHSPEVKERAVRMAFEHEGEYPSRRAAIRSIASKIGCSAKVLRKWAQQAERDQGLRPGLTSDERKRLKDLEGENFELRRANEILRKAGAFSPRRRSLRAKCDEGVVLGRSGQVPPFAAWESDEDTERADGGGRGTGWFGDASAAQ
jgi:transposase